MNNNLLLWPKEKIAEDKTERIILSLMECGIIRKKSDKHDFSHESGNKIGNYLNFTDNYDGDSFQIGFSPFMNYEYELDDKQITIDKTNVVVLVDMADYITNVDKLCNKLLEITGDEYVPIVEFDGFIEEF